MLGEELRSINLDIRPSWGVRDGKIYRTEPIGMTPLKNSIILEPMESVPPEYQKAYENTCDMYGKDRVDTLRSEKKTVMVLYPFAGMGHAYQAKALAEFYQAIGCRVVLADIFEIADPDASVRLEMERSVLKAIQTGENGPWDKIKRKGNAVDELVAQISNIGFKIYNSMATDTHDTEKEGFSTRLNRAMGSWSHDSKHVWPFLFRKVLSLEQQFVMNPMRESLVAFCDAMNADLIATTHTWSIRPLIGTKYEKKTFSSVPDKGYEDLTTLYAFMTPESRIALGVPDANVEKLARENYLIARQNLFGEMGTLAVAPAELARKKWDESERWVMISASGNNDNVSYMVQALENGATRLREPNDPYRLVLFLGMHEGKEVLDKIKNLGLDQSNHIVVVQTKTIPETTSIRWFWKMRCQVDFARTGENPFDSGQLGTLNIGLVPSGRNELRNMHYAAHLWGAAIPSAWPPKTHAYWKKTKEFADFSAPGFTTPQENIFLYLDHLYGENTESINYAKMYGIRGLYTVPHRAGEYYLALGIGKMLPHRQEDNFGYDERELPEFYDDYFNRRFKHFRKESERAEKLMMVRKLLTTEWKDAPAVADWLEDNMLELAGYQPGEMDQFLEEIAPKVLVVTEVGGASSRWKNSFDEKEGKIAMAELGIDINYKSKTRTLAPVPVKLTDNYPDKKYQPIIAWNFAAVKMLINLGAKHLIIAGNDADKVELLGAAHKMGITGSDTALQDIRPGKEKVSGHGDAILQQLGYLRDANQAGKEYIVAHFGGDATDSHSIHMSLLAMHVLRKYGEEVSGVLPTAPMAVPKYPVYIDPLGTIVALGHEKTLGSKSVGNPLGTMVKLPVDGQIVQLETGGSNVGLWIFDLEQAIKVFENVGELFEAQKSFAGLPGHEEAGVDEFALDDVARMLSGTRQIAIADEDEIRSTVKSLQDIKNFLAMITSIKKRQTERDVRRATRVVINRSFQ